LSGSSQRLVENDDWLRALPPLAEAIRLGTGNERLDRANRVRFATLVRSSPELRYVWADGRKIIRVETDVEGKRLLIVTPKSADIWELEPRPTMKHRWNAPKEWRLGAMSYDGARVVLSSSTNQFMLYDTRSGEMLGEGDGVISPLGAFGMQGRTFITFSGTTAVVHSGRGGEPVLPPLNHEAPVAWAAVPWPKCTLTQDKNGRLYLWDGEGELSVPAFKVRESSEPLALAAMSRNSGEIALQGGKDLYLIDGSTGKVKVNLQAAGGIQTIGTDSSGAGAWVYLARRDTGVEVREVEKDTLRFSASHGALGFRGAFAPFADLLATQSWNGSTRAWKLSNGRPESPLLWLAATPGDCLLDRKGTWLLTRSDEPAMRLWRLRREDDTALRDIVAYDPLSAWFEGSPERIRLADRKGRVYSHGFHHRQHCRAATRAR
jgi:WD40 repeat protein